VRGARVECPAGTRPAVTRRACTWAVGQIMAQQGAPPQLPSTGFAIALSEPIRTRRFDRLSRAKDSRNSSVRSAKRKMARRRRTVGQRSGLGERKAGAADYVAQAGRRLRGSETIRVLQTLRDPGTALSHHRGHASIRRMLVSQLHRSLYRSITSGDRSSWPGAFGFFRPKMHPILSLPRSHVAVSRRTRNLGN